MSIRGRGITLYGRAAGRVLHMKDWRHLPVHAPRLKAKASRITKKLMRPGSPWASYGVIKAYVEKTRIHAAAMVQYLNVKPETAVRIAMLGIRWDDVCISISDPHRCIAEEFEDEYLTLAELHGIATCGLSRRPWGYLGRVAGMPADADVALAPRVSIDDVIGAGLPEVSVLER